MKIVVHGFVILNSLKIIATGTEIPNVTKDKMRRTFQVYSAATWFTLLEARGLLNSLLASHKRSFTARLPCIF